MPLQAVYKIESRVQQLWRWEIPGKQVLSFVEHACSTNELTASEAIPRGGCE